jgi:hypothetical protein
MCVTLQRVEMGACMGGAVQVALPSAATDDSGPEILAGTKRILREQMRGWLAWGESTAAGVHERDPARGGDGCMHG